ncbi:MAG: type II toxin-antitoxin system RelB/DinJ family antitoxin, partial [Candidatus Methanomethylophilaceae archaeon]|nr:type II toxin-antitoxin system RelB/DinJ family antitoxin [Candidatus Methanomethylophilaceae archaeon]
KMYNQYIASVYDEVAGGIVSMGRGSVINARVDPVVKAKAERILLDNGLTPSEAVEQFYRRVISENGISFLRERARYAFYEQNAVTRIGHFQMPRAFRSLSATP